MEFEQTLLIVVSIIVGIIGVYYIYKHYEANRKQKEFVSLVHYFKKHRKLIQLKESNNNDIIRAMTYNILAPKWAMTEKHNYCPRKYRLFPYRLTRILAEIVAYKPDIICMQETTADVYNRYLSKEMHNLGYNGEHDPRSIEKDDAAVTIFWNKDKYELLQTKAMIFNQICDEEKYAKYLGTKHENNKFYQRLKSRSNIILVVHLKDVSSNKEFIVVTSHLYWDPTWCDVKVLSHALQKIWRNFVYQ